MKLSLYDCMWYHSCTSFSPLCSLALPDSSEVQNWILAITSSYTNFNKTHFMLLIPSPFFPAILQLSLQGTFHHSFEFSVLSLLFFHQLQDKSNCLVCKNTLVFWYTFFGYWMCFSSLCTLKLGCVKTNINSNSIV